MRVLVTGGAGFIGSHIVEELLAQKNDIVVLDDVSTGNASNVPINGVKFIRATITDHEALENAMNGVDLVFHEAAQTSVARSLIHPKETWEINIRGTKLLLNAAVKAGVKRVVFASSAAVYGNAIPPLKESKDPKPISPYGDSKRMGELLMQEYSEKEGLETISLRYFNVYGQRQNPKSEYSGVISKFIDRMANDLRPVIYGSGTQSRDFIFVKDVVAANMLAAKAKKAKGEVYNIATGSVISINELVKTLNAVLGKNIEPIFEPERAGDIKFSYADVSLAKGALGFEAKTPIQEGLKETVKWLQEQRYP